MRSTLPALLVQLSALALAAACARAPVSPGSAAPGAARAELNRAARELALPLFWTADADGNGEPDAPEVAVIWGLDAR